MRKGLEQMILRLDQNFLISRLYNLKGWELINDIINRINIGWVKWKGVSRVFCDRKIPLRLKDKFYRTFIKLV